MHKLSTFLILLTLVLVACGTDGSHFAIDGRLLNLNQGEFYVYSTDGLIDGIDTIHVRAGRFSYSTPCEGEGTLVIIFPNFSEQPVFAEAGKTVTIKGDATHLKEMEVKGGKENKIMNSFRQQTLSASPQEMREAVDRIVSDHPESLTAIYLVRRYFVDTSDHDYAHALQLMEKMLAAQPDNGRLAQQTKALKALVRVDIGKPLPAFSVKDVNGQTITNKDFAHGEGIIYALASWEWESCNVMRMLRDSKQEGLHILGVSIDASTKDVKRTITANRIETPITCDEKMMQGDLITRLGITQVPYNIIVRNGKIVERNLTTQQLRERYGK